MLSPGPENTQASQRLYRRLKEIQQALARPEGRVLMFVRYGVPSIGMVALAVAVWFEADVWLLRRMRGARKETR